MSAQKIKEANLWRWLSQAQTKSPELMLMRVENSVGSGTPDVYGCLQGTSFWLELKALALPKNERRVSIGLSPAQISWLYNHYRAGGRSGALIQYGSGADKMLFVVPGREILPFQDFVSLSYLRFAGKQLDKAAPLEVIHAIAYYV